MNKILIVDDSLSLRMMLSMVLSEAGYEVETAENGKTGYEKTLEINPRLVITDLNMPEESGIDLLTNLRKNERFKFLPVLVLTTDFEEEKKKACKAAGATGWLGKPFDPEKLVAVVKKLTNN